MTVKAMLVYDNCDDRKEIHRLLERLPPAKRLAWLQDCCRRCTLPGSNTSPVVTRCGNAMEVFYDAWMLVKDYNMDMDAALKRLVQIARRA